MTGLEYREFRFETLVQPREIAHACLDAGIHSMQILDADPATVERLKTQAGEKA